jgi:hypothetical protein
MPTLQWAVVKRQHRSPSRGTKARWILVLAGFVSGLVLWAAGIHAGIVIAGVSAIGFVVAAWLDVGPQGGHVHDDGMISRGVPETPHLPN